jgi:putative peptide zinc metalloprotease protein
MAKRAWMKSRTRSSESSPPRKSRRLNSIACWACSIEQACCCRTVLAIEKTRQQRRAIAGQVLSLRFRGVDPDRFLDWLNQYFGWLFSQAAAVLVFGLALAALLLVGAEFDTFRSRLPQFRSFFAADNWVWLSLTLCVTKVLHELGHGLACKRFGGRCHEMGVMLLCFTPCLYCNVTDSWIIPSKWRRAAIGAAGMYVELLIASLATFGWWFSHPGLLNHLCLNAMFVCSVSTLMFNANPLLRYDGYYILSDVLEIPNLRSKASAVLRQSLGKWLLGLPPQRDPFLPTRNLWLFSLYSVASPVYGWLVSVSIFWFLYGVLKAAGLIALTPLLGGVMLWGLFVMPLWRIARLLYAPQRSRRVKKMRAAICIGALIAAVSVLLIIPLPYYVVCPLHVQPRDATALYVDSPGNVRKIFVQGGPVSAGQPIVLLENPELEIAHQRLLAQRDQLATRIDGIRSRATSDQTALLELAHTQEALDALEEQLERHQRELDRLTIRAPHDGILLPAPERPRDSNDRLRLASWSGRPLAKQNVGAYLEPSVVVGRIATFGQWEALLAVPQQEVEFLAPGQWVDLILEQLPGERFSGELLHISQEELDAAPPGLSSKSGGPILTQTDGNGRERPLETTFQASVPIDSDRILVAGGTGTAKVHAGYQPLWQRGWRAFCRTFRFEL